MRAFQLAMAAAFLSCAACSSDDEGTETTITTAVADIEAKSGNTSLQGTATFVQQDGKTKLTLTVTGAPPGEHGAHIHETGDCSAADAASAGGHWNPATHDHGMPAPTSHLGDLGNLTVKADGTGTLTLEKTEWIIVDEGDPTGDVTEKAIIIHANADDFTTQPTGNAGGRIGCGVIEWFSEETISTKEG
jgi:Cu-Zn family superoxide dismutase